MNNSGLILPFATIIETGNHIAHCGDGNERRKTAQKFCKCIEKTVTNEAPWQYYGNQLTAEDLSEICRDFPDFAMRESILTKSEDWKYEFEWRIIDFDVWTFVTK